MPVRDTGHSAWQGAGASEYTLLGRSDYRHNMLGSIPGEAGTQTFSPSVFSPKATIVFTDSKLDQSFVLSDFDLWQAQF